MKKTTLYPIMIILLAALAFAQGVTHDPSEITPGIYGGGSTEAYSYNSMVIANQGVQAYPNSGSSYAIYGRGDGNGLGYVGYGRAGIYGYGMATGRWGAGMTAFNANDVGTGVFSYVSGTGSYGYRAESPAGATGTSGMRIDIMASNANGVESLVYGSDSYALYAWANPALNSYALRADGNVVVNGDTDLNGNTDLNGDTTINGVTVINGATTINGDTVVNGGVTATGQVCDVTGCIGAAVGGSDDDWRGVGDVDPTLAGDIYHTGGVGIGTTSPAAKLHVNVPGTLGIQQVVAVVGSSISKRPVLQFSESTSGSSSAGMSIEYDGTSTGANNKMYIRDYDANPLMTIKNGGDVGIGTTDPSAKLEVEGSSPYFRIDNTDETLSGIQIRDTADTNNQHGSILFHAGDDACSATGYGNSLNFYLGAIGGAAYLSDDELVMKMKHNCPPNDGSTQPVYLTTIQDNLEVTGNFIVTNHAIANKSMFVGDNLQVQDNLQVGGNLAVYGDINVAGNLNVMGKICVLDTSMPYICPIGWVDETPSSCPNKICTGETSCSAPCGGTCSYKSYCWIDPMTSVENCAWATCYGYIPVTSHKICCVGG